MPKSYGSPVGYQPPDPKRQQRAVPATDAQVHAAYQAHMREAHEAFLAARKAGQTPRPRGSSAAPGKARGSVPGIDAAVLKAGG